MAELMSANQMDWQLLALEITARRKGAHHLGCDHHSVAFTKARMTRRQSFAKAAMPGSLQAPRSRPWGPCQQCWKLQRSRAASASYVSTLHKKNSIARRLSMQDFGHKIGRFKKEGIEVQKNSGRDGRDEPRCVPKYSIPVPSPHITPQELKKI